MESFLFGFHNLKRRFLPSKTEGTLDDDNELSDDSRCNDIDFSPPQTQTLLCEDCLARERAARRSHGGARPHHANGHGPAGVVGLSDKAGAWEEHFKIDLLRGLLAACRSGNAIAVLALLKQAEETYGLDAEEIVNSQDENDQTLVHITTEAWSSSNFASRDLVSLENKLGLDCCCQLYVRGEERRHVCRGRPILRTAISPTACRDIHTYQRPSLLLKKDDLRNAVLGMVPAPEDDQGHLLQNGDSVVNGQPVQNGCRDEEDNPIQHAKMYRGGKNGRKSKMQIRKSITDPCPSDLTLGHDPNDVIDRRDVLGLLYPRNVFSWEAIRGGVNDLAQLVDNNWSILSDDAYSVNYDLEGFTHPSSTGDMFALCAKAMTSRPPASLDRKPHASASRSHIHRHGRSSGPCAQHHSNHAGDYRSVLVTLYTAGADLNKKDKWGETALHTVVNHGHVTALDTLLSLKDLDLDAQNAEGCTPITKVLTSWGATPNALHVTTSLLRAGCSLNVPDFHGMYPLMDAIENRKFDLFEVMLRLGNADINAVDSRGRTCLHLAVLYAHNNIVCRLINSPGCDPGIQDHDGFTPLYLCVWNPFSNANMDQVALTSRLAASGADVNQGDNQWTLPIIHAWKNPTLVKILVQHGAKVDGRVNGGEFTFLELAALEGKWEIVEVLLKAGVPIPESIQRERTTKQHLDAERRRSLENIWRQEKYKPTYQRLTSACYTIRGLRDLCRVRVRQLVTRRRRPLFKAIARLPLPDPVLDFLRMRDIWDWHHGTAGTAACLFDDVTDPSPTVNKCHLEDFKPDKRHSI